MHKNSVSTRHQPLHSKAGHDKYEPKVNKVVNNEEKASRNKIREDIKKLLEKTEDLKRTSEDINTERQGFIPLRPQPNTF